MGASGAQGGAAVPRLSRTDDSCVVLLQRVEQLLLDGQTRTRVEHDASLQLPGVHMTMLLLVELAVSQCRPLRSQPARPRTVGIRPFLLPRLQRYAALAERMPVHRLASRLPAPEWRRLRQLALCLHGLEALSGLRLRRLEVDAGLVRELAEEGPVLNGLAVGAQPVEECLPFFTRHVNLEHGKRLLELGAVCEAIRILIPV